jgi:SAM-dependent methyltransferase
MAAETYIIRGGIQGRERLRLLSRVMRPNTESVLSRVGVGAGMSCLDAGCGGGDVTRWLATRSAPGGRAIGIDVDAAKLELARQEAEILGVENVAFLEADVTAGELAGEFDLVYARFLLTHMPDPDAVAARLARSLRPGGFMVVEDIDYSGGFCQPERDVFRRYSELYTGAARARGVDPDIGPKLPGILERAGCDGVRANVVQPAGRRSDGYEGDAKLVVALTMENIADAAVAAEVATRAEVDSVVDGLYRLAADDTTYMSFPRIVQAWGRRPR